MILTCKSYNLGDLVLLYISMESCLKYCPYLTSVVITVKGMMNWGIAIIKDGTGSWH